MKKGQALLIVVLSMAVILTIVLSILSRSISDIRVTSQEEEAIRAFSAAEAGVEQALITGATGGSIGEANFNASVTTIAEGQNYFNYPTEVASGDIATLWFISHADDGSLVCNATKPCFSGPSMKVCWGKPGTPNNAATTPAVEVAIIYTTTPGDYSTSRVAREAYDPNSARRATNAFSAPDSGACTISGISFAFQKSVTFSSLGIPAGTYGSQNGLQLARVRMLYNTDSAQSLGTDVNFAGNGTLPSQGRQVTSTGTSGEATRKVEVFSLFSDLPPVFDSAAFSLGGLTK